MNLKTDLETFYNNVRKKGENHPLDLQYEKSSFVVCIDTYDEAKKVLGENMPLIPAIYLMENLDQKKYLIFVPDVYFENMTPEGFAFTVAHEIGHAVLGHDGTAKNYTESIQHELEADAFAVGLVGRNGGVEMFRALRKGVKKSFGLIKGSLKLFSLKGECRARLNALTRI